MTQDTNFPLKTSENIAAIKAWWTAFKTHEDQICDVFSKGTDFDIVGFMGRNLHAISDRVMWEYGPGLTKAHRLALSAEEDRQVEPLVSLIMAMTPDDLVHFDIVKGRPHTDWEAFEAGPSSRFTWQSPKGVVFTAVPGEHNLIDITFYMQPEHQDDHSFQNCFVMAETLLGETVFETWIGQVNVAETPLKKGLFSKNSAPNIPPNAKPVHMFREAIAVQIAAVKNKLAQKPLYEIAEDGSWQLVKMEPEAQADYPKMDDLMTMPVSSLGPGLSLYSGQARFLSERFSALGEDFIYIKMDGSADDLNQEIFGDRAEVEDALNAALMEAKAGGVIGGGTGLKYSYIFLAVTDLEASVELIKKTLREGRLTRRSWILFNDFQREQEWIGIWDDTPTPVLPDYSQD